MNRQDQTFVKFDWNETVIRSPQRSRCGRALAKTTAKLSKQVMQFFEMLTELDRCNVPSLDLH